MVVAAPFLHGAPERFQADARVLERRAHGHPRRRRGARRRRRLRRACSICSNNGLTKGVALSSRGQHPPRAREQELRRGARRPAPSPGLGERCFSRGSSPSRRSPPFGPFFSEFTHPQRRRDQRPLRRGSGVPGCMLVSRSSGWDATVLTVVQGKPSERAASTTVRDRFWYRRADAPPSWRLSSWLGLYIPAVPSTIWLRDAAASLEADDERHRRIALTRNGHALDRTCRALAGVEEFGGPSLDATSRAAPCRGAWFGVAGGDGVAARRRARLRRGGTLAVGRSARRRQRTPRSRRRVRRRTCSSARVCGAAWAVVPQGHPWLKPVRSRAPGHDAWAARDGAESA